LRGSVIIKLKNWQAKKKVKNTGEEGTSPVFS